jgi:hypothetical protein
MTKTVTDANGTTHFFDVFNGTSVLGTAMAFLPAGIATAESVPMGLLSRPQFADLDRGPHQGDEAARLPPLLASKKVLW